MRRHCVNAPHRFFCYPQSSPLSHPPLCLARRFSHFSAVTTRGHGPLAAPWSHKFFCQRLMTSSFIGELQQAHTLVQDDALELLGSSGPIVMVWSNGQHCITTGTSRLADVPAALLRSTGHAMKAVQNTKLSHERAGGGSQCWCWEKGSVVIRGVSVAVTPPVGWLRGRERCCVGAVS
jgi:hypothetical protein